MDEATANKQPAKKSVAPFNAEHGVNPGWGVYEERPVIPEFSGVAEISKLALMFTLWSRIETFLYDEIGLEPLASAKEEKKNRTTLLESETYIVALLCLLNNDHYSAGGLVDAMVGVDASADQRGNARKRILNRTLPIVGDRYKLIDYSERHKGNSMEYSICRSERLVEFAETHLVPTINSIFGTARSSAKNRSANNVNSASQKMPAGASKTQTKSRTSAAKKSAGTKSTTIKSTGKVTTDAKTRASKNSASKNAGSKASKSKIQGTGTVRSKKTGRKNSADTGGEK